MKRTPEISPISSFCDDVDHFAKGSSGAGETPVTAKSTSTEEAAQDLRRDPELKNRLREFLATDNHTNFLYILRAWTIAAFTIGGAVAFFEFRGQWGISALWNIPVYLIALAVVGASQHQLAGAVHEAVHHTLFRNRKLNEIVGDWLCAFPLLTSVYQFRLYHLAHHQFVNDPERDPDFALLKDSGHWLSFPVSKGRFLWMMFRQIFLVDLMKYILVRVRYNTVGTHANSPYQVQEERPRRLPVRGATAVFLFVIANTAVVQKWGEPWMLLVFPAIFWIGYGVLLFTLPGDAFPKARIRPLISPRIVFLGQTGCFTLTVSVLAYFQATTGFLALRYFSMLWYGAIFTTFPFFLILRQVIQHGNGDRSWLANTRVFRMNAFVRYAIFPFGMDFHLPHHMYATVPHYRLRAFHEFLMTRPAYREHCRVVDNYLIPGKQAPRNPTVVEVLGPEHAVTGQEVHIDNTVLDDCEVEDLGAIEEEVRASGRPA